MHASQLHSHPYEWASKKRKKLLKSTEKGQMHLKKLQRPSRPTLSVFGKILYALAMADGAIQETEIQALEEIVAKDKWAKHIQFSFRMAQKMEMDPKTAFFKNIRVFRTYPVDEHYPYFLELMEKIAKAHEGIVPSEQQLIDQFKKMLKPSIT